MPLWRYASDRKQGARGLQVPEFFWILLDKLCQLDYNRAMLTSVYWNPVTDQLLDGASVQECSVFCVGPFWIRGSVEYDLLGATRVRMDARGISLPIRCLEHVLRIPFPDGSYYVCRVNKKPVFYPGQKGVKNSQK